MDQEGLVTLAEGHIDRRDHGVYDHGAEEIQSDDARAARLWCWSTVKDLWKGKPVKS